MLQIKREFMSLEFPKLPRVTSFDDLAQLTDSRKDLFH